MTKLILSMIALTLICLPWSEASAQTQRDMNDDAAASFKAADKKLNAMYQKILKDYADDRFGSGDGERKTLLTRQMPYEPLPASVLFGVLVLLMDVFICESWAMECECL